MAEPPGPCGAGRFCCAYAACWADGLLCGVAAPRVLRASRVLFGGLGCLVCRWAAVFLLVVCCPDRFPAAARPPIGRCVCVLSGQAPPPPAGTAAGLADLLLVAPLVLRAPDGPAAREARRPHFVRRRASKPARALRSLRRPPHRRGLSLCVARPFPPPPTGTAARPRYGPTGPASALAHIAAELPNFDAIPPRLFQTMNLQRWNCNVFRLY